MRGTTSLGPAAPGLTPATSRTGVPRGPSTVRTPAAGPVPRGLHCPPPPTTTTHTHAQLPAVSRPWVMLFCTLLVAVLRGALHSVGGVVAPPIPRPPCPASQPILPPSFTRMLWAHHGVGLAIQLPSCRLRVARSWPLTICPSSMTTWWATLRREGTFAWTWCVQFWQACAPTPTPHPRHDEDDEDENEHGRRWGWRVCQRPTTSNGSSFTGISYTFWLLVASLIFVG